MKKLISIILIVTMLLSTILLAIPANALEFVGDAIENWVGTLGEINAEGAQNSTTKPVAGVPEGYTQKSYKEKLKSEGYIAVGTGEGKVAFASMAAGNKYYLDEDITVTAQKGWMSGAPFELDGCGHTINYTGSNALFSGSDSAITIKNLNLKGTITYTEPADPEKRTHTSGLVQHGNNGTSTVENVVVDVAITVNGISASVAGIWGKTNSATITFTNVHFVGSLTVNGNINDGGYGGVGGFIGKNENGVATFTNCTNTANIAVNGLCNVKGIGGFIGTSIHATNFTNCVNSGNITLNEPSGDWIGDNAAAKVGGFVGYIAEADGTIKLNGCENRGTVSILNRTRGGSTTAGGFLGNGINGVVSEFTNCINSGAVNVEATLNTERIGGFVGEI